MKASFFFACGKEWMTLTVSRSIRATDPTKALSLSPAIRASISESIKDRFYQHSQRVLSTAEKSRQTLSLATFLVRSSGSRSGTVDPTNRHDYNEHFTQKRKAQPRRGLQREVKTRWRKAPKNSTLKYGCNSLSSLARCQFVPQRHANCQCLLAQR